MQDCLEVQAAHSKKLMRKQGVQGTAVGEKWIDGKPTGEKALLIFVQKKFSAESISNPNVLTKFTVNDLIPAEIDGVRTDVIEVGRITKQAGFRNKIRPIKPGFSVGHGDITAGTIGGIFLDKNNEPVILSNNHVLANENKAKIGDLIYQPGPTDSRESRRDIGWQEPVSGLPYIATLKKFMKINKTGNIHDSAIATIHPKLVQSGLIDELYPQINTKLAGFGEATIGMQVQKCGRTTGYTTGRVLGLNASFTIEYDFGNATFDKCIVTSAMSQGGDSGSIIQDMNERAIGLLFAGSPKVTLANPIDIVQSYYGLKLYSGVDDVNTNTVNVNNNSWVVRRKNESDNVIVADNVVKLTAAANHHACIERGISSLKMARCTIYTGTDKGATWGPGLSIHWPNGCIKINIRHNSTFGGYFNGAYNIDIGKTKENTEYTLRVRATRNAYIGEVKDGGKWYTILEVPTKHFNQAPMLLRIGKTDINGNITSHGSDGEIGESIIKDIMVQ